MKLFVISNLQDCGVVVFFGFFFFGFFLPDETEFLSMIRQVFNLILPIVM